MEAQQLLGLLGIDATQLSEDGHDLQEQEPVGSQRRRWDIRPPPSPSYQTDPVLRVHKFKLRTAQ